MGGRREYTGENLVFVVGAPRSGTTWLQRLLASHARVRTGQETNLFCSYIGPMMRMWRFEVEREADPRRATGRGGTGLPCYFTEEEYVGRLREHLFSLLDGITRDLRPGEIFLEKSPDHARFIPEIKAMLPRARIVHLLRDPREVVSSLLAAAEGWGRGWAPRRADRAAALWVTNVRAAREAARHLSPAEYRELRYEELMADPAAVLEEMAGFLGLAWDRGAIERAVAANRPEEVRRGGGTPIPLRGEFARGGGVVSDPADFVRASRGEGSWRTRLTVRQKIEVWRSVRRLMRECGYSWSARDWLASTRS